MHVLLVHQFQAGLHELMCAMVFASWRRASPLVGAVPGHPGHVLLALSPNLPLSWHAREVDCCACARMSPPWPAMGAPCVRS